MASSIKIKAARSPGHANTEDAACNVAPPLYLCMDVPHSVRSSELRALALLPDKHAADLATYSDSCKVRCWKPRRLFVLFFVLFLCSLARYPTE